MSPLANLAQIEVARVLINSLGRDAVDLLVVSTAFALAEAHAETLFSAGRQTRGGA
jgi:hypothetical protein